MIYPQNIKLKTILTRSETLRDLPEEPPPPYEHWGARLRGGDLEEERLQGPVQEVLLMLSRAEGAGEEAWKSIKNKF